MEIRPLRPDDAEAIVALYASCMATEPGIGPITAAGWTGTIRLPQFAGGRDFLVAMDGAELVGSAESSLRTGGAQPTRMVKIMVHPGRRRSGIAASLLRAVLAQGPDEPALVIEGFARQTWPAGLAALRHWGFSQTEAEIAMHCDALTPPREGPLSLAVAPVPAAGVEEVLEQIADIHNQAYAGDAGFSRTRLNDQRESLRGTRLWVARRADAIVAFAVIERDPGLVWLESIAVLPAAQGAGVGEALVRQALRAEGMDQGRPAGLSVSSRSPAALRLYGRLGFTERSRKGRYAAPRALLLARLGC